MPHVNRAQIPFRLPQDDKDRLYAKVKNMGTNVQQFLELMVTSFLKNNKEITRLVKVHTSEALVRRSRMEMNPLEYKELMRLIEEEYSPLKDLHYAAKELDEEEEDLIL